MTLRNRLLTATAVLSLSAAITGGVFITTTRAEEPAAGKEAKRPGARQNPMMKQLEELNLTPEQKEKIKAIMEAHRAQIKSLTPEQRESQRKELGKNIKEDIMKVLTPEQKQKLQAAGPAKGPGGEARGAGAPGVKMLGELNLTPEQKEKIAPILEDTRAEAKKLQENQALEPRERAEKMRKLQQDTFARIKPILTAEQQTKHEELMQKNREEAKKRGGEKRGEKRQGNKPAIL